MKQFKIQLAILTASTLLMRGAAVLFSGYLNRKIGPVGVGTYSLLMNVYGLFITFSSFGVRLACTRLCTAQSAVNKSPFGASLACIKYAVCFGFLGGAVLYISAAPIAKAAVSNVSFAPCLRLMSASLPFTAAASALGGYFVSQNRLPFLSFVSIGEQFLKIGLCMAVLESCGTVANGPAVPILVSAACEVVYFAVLFVAWLKNRRSDRLPPSFINPGEVWKTALPLGVSYCLRNGLFTVQQLLIPRALRTHGASADQTIGVYGTIHGLVFPALMLPIAPIDSAGELLIAKLTRLQAQNKREQITDTASRALNTTLSYSLMFASIFARYGEETGRYAYASDGLGKLFLVLCPLVVLYYIDEIADSMLKGLGCQLASMRYSMTDSLLGIILILLLLPRYGIYGYVAALYITKLLNLWLSLNKLLLASGATVCGRHTFWLCLPAVVLLLPRKLPFVPSAVLFTGMYVLAARAVFCRIKKAKA